jgi:hypothetical protein
LFGAFAVSLEFAFVRRAFGRAALFALTLFVVEWAASSSAQAQAIYTRWGDPAKNQAAKRLEDAQRRLRDFVHFQEPLAERSLDRERRLLQAEIASTERHLNEAALFNRYITIGQPLFHDEEHYRIQLLRQRIQLEALDDQRMLQLRSFQDQRRALQEEVERARESFPK